MGYQSPRNRPSWPAVRARGATSTSARISVCAVSSQGHPGMALPRKESRTAPLAIAT